MLEWPEDVIELKGDELFRRDTGRRYPWADLLNQAGQPIFCEIVSKDAAPSSVTAFTAQVAEVSVDLETGQVELLTLTTAHDVGTIVNPVGHEGQINGGVVQGVGYGLIEEVIVEEGHVGTVHFGEYKIPTFMDIPELRTVLLQGDGAGPYGVKGIGENPMPPVAAAIANAVEDAVGVRIRDLPITAEKVYRALREKDRPKA
jgi:CO/xanthine dehydrogenase Mo-binding subunit